MYTIKDMWTIFTSTTGPSKPVKWKHSILKNFSSKDEKILIRTTLFNALFLISLGSIAQDQSTLAQQLGYAPDAKLLIIHADDIGLAQSVNQASITAYETGEMQSVAINHPAFGSVKQ